MGRRRWRANGSRWPARPAPLVDGSARASRGTRDHHEGDRRRIAGGRAGGGHRAPPGGARRRPVALAPCRELGVATPDGGPGPVDPKPVAGPGRTAADYRTGLTEASVPRSSGVEPELHRTRRLGAPGDVGLDGAGRLPVSGDRPLVRIGAVQYDLRCGVGRQSAGRPLRDALAPRLRL